VTRAFAARVGAAALVLGTLGVTACGQKGPPLPPLRPAPAPVNDLTAERHDDRITLRFTVPPANTDGSTPVTIDRVELYAISTPQGATAPTPLQLVDSKNLVATIAVRPPDGPAPAADAPPDTRLAPGAAASYVDQMKPDPAAPAAARHYAALGYTGRRRGAYSGVVSVPLTRKPAAAGALSFKHDGTTLTISWPPPAAAGVVFRVYEHARQEPPVAALLTKTPITTAELAVPVEFGVRKCFSVETVEVIGRVTLNGERNAGDCVTPADTFPPPAPAKLVAAPVEGGVELVWTPPDAPDVAGYRVLRGDSPNAILQQLSRELVAETRFRDTTVKSGVTYIYSVIAVDKSGNESEQSNRQEVTARAPFGRATERPR
jgi:hypothetical protein